jgi:hypothetical protein
LDDVAKILIELNDRIIADDGTVVARYSLLDSLAIAGKPLNSMPALDHPEIRFYNRRRPDMPITIWADDGEDRGPDPATRAWKLPEPYVSLDVREVVLAEAEFRLGATCSDAYVDRLLLELDEMEKRGMYDFVRALIFIRDRFTEHGVIMGVGRGSSCASLVLFVLGLHRVDPVLHDIPLGEFLK